jgi:hypothetical protein
VSIKKVDGEHEAMQAMIDTWFVQISGFGADAR